MAHVEYDEWVRYIERIIERFSATKSPRIFEVGAGTGSLAVLLAESGLSCVISDLCPAMAKIARQKGLRVCVSDARSFPVKARFDLVLFMYDGINYFFTLSDFTKFFEQAHAVLDENGLLLFDITTQTNSLRYFRNTLDFEDLDKASFVRHSYYNESDSTQHNDFTLYLKTPQSGDFFEKQVERHVQKVFPIHSIQSAVPKALFDIVGIWNGYTFSRATANTERAHFLLKKKAVPK